MTCKSYQILITLQENNKIMVQETSISLGSHFENFVTSAIAEGKYNNVSEVVRAGLRLLEEEENRNERIRAALMEAKNSGTVENYDRHAHLKSLQEKYKKNVELQNK